MIIPSNYRQLKTDEIVRRGDLCRHEWDHVVFPAKNSIGLSVGAYPSSIYTFWRRRHAKATPLSRAAAAPTPAQPTAKKNVTIVEFTYNWKSRRVQLISLDSQYLTGLEITREGSRYSYQFKKYLRYKIDNGFISLYHYGEPLTNS
jgi:hypothetical protein